jgi:hypothetical protein
MFLMFIGMLVIGDQAWLSMKPPSQHSWFPDVEDRDGP